MPDTVSVRVVGLDRLLKGLEVAPATLEKESRKAMGESMRLVKGLLVGRIPTGPGREGHLRDLISMQVVGPPIRGLLDEHKFTGRFLEFGTKPHIIKEPSGLVIHHPGARAKHPMRKAYGAAKRLIVAYFLSAATETVRDIVKGG